MLDIQNAWNNLGMGNFSGTMQSSASTGRNIYRGAGGSSGVASLQDPLSLAASGISSKANVPGMNQVELPSWLSTNPDQNMGELLSAYGGIGAAFDPTEQVAARNNAIGYNTSAGTQMANNAATEYSNRAAQSGASQLGAGVVKAQAMMPVLAQNAALKTDAADIAAKTHQEGASLAAQIASTIGNLRTSYLQTLTQTAMGQQQLALQKFQAEQSAAQGAGQLQLGWAGLQADQYKSSMAAKQGESDQARLAAMALLGQRSPSGQYSVDNQGKVMGGQDVYNAYKNWQTNQTSAQNTLRGMLV